MPNDLSGNTLNYMTKLVIFVIAVFFRFLYLGVVPASLAHDEIDNIIQAHAFIHTGTDIAGTWNPLSLLPNSGVMAEWGPLINAVAVRFLPSTPFTARATTALLSSVFPLLIWVLLEKWGVRRRVAGVTAALIAVSPWHILFSRTALEQPVSLFFYTVSWIYLTDFLKRGNSVKKNLSTGLVYVATYMSGFMLYHGYKFSLPFLTCALIMWLTFKEKARIGKVVIAFSIIGLLFGHVVVHRSVYQSRSGELIFSSTTAAAQSIDNDRRQTVAPEWLKRVFSNKVVYLGSLMADKYAGIFSPDLLFLHGEANGVFSVWKTGYVSFYVIPLLIIGLYRMMKERKREQVLILILLLMSPLTSVVQSNNSYAFRSALFFVFLLSIAAYGLDYAASWLEKNRVYRNAAVVLFTFGSAISFGYFFYIYYYLTPVANANAYFLGDRIVGNYIRLTENKKILIIDPQPRYIYSNIVLADTHVTAEDIAGFGHSYSPSDLDIYRHGGLTVMRSCPADNSENFDTVIIHSTLMTGNTSCPAIKDLEKRPYASFVSPKDSGEERRIYGETLCGPKLLATYIHPVALSDFSLENMNTQEFCSKWIVRQ